MNAAAADLLELIAREEGLSTARACKQLGLSRSELQRLLTQLGAATTVAGLGLVRVETAAGRETLWLSASARAARGLA
jgi:DNA-binding IclR family transcriptional regulator